MDFDFTKEQDIFRSGVRDFLQREYPLVMAREIEDTKQGYSSDVYQKMAGTLCDRAGNL